MVFINNKRQTPKSVSRILGTLLEEFLGTYTYDNGQTRVAVSIGKPLHTGTVRGLELIIPRCPDIRKHLELWNCYVIDRNDDSSEKLADLVDRLRCSHESFPLVTYLPATSEFNNYEQIYFQTNTGALNVIERGLGLA